MEITVTTTEEYRKYRKDNFDVSAKIDKDYVTKETIVEICYTLNGYQWHTFSFTQDEWKKVRMCADFAFEQLESGKDAEDGKEV